MKCRGCQRPVKEGDQFCSQCGLKDPGEVPRPSCTNCNKVLDENAKFCPSCGNKVLRKCMLCGAELTQTGTCCENCDKKVQSPTSKDTPNEPETSPDEFNVQRGNPPSGNTDSCVAASVQESKHAAKEGESRRKPAAGSPSRNEAHLPKLELEQSEQNITRDTRNEGGEDNSGNEEDVFHDFETVPTEDAEASQDELRQTKRLDPSESVSKTAAPVYIPGKHKPLAEVPDTRTEKGSATDFSSDEGHSARNIRRQERSSGQKSAQGQAESSARKRRNETVEIAFHVVVSRQFEDVTGVYVNVDGKRHELYKRSENETGYLFEEQLEIATSIKPSVYSYSVEKGGKKKRSQNVYTEQTDRNLPCIRPCTETGSAMMYDFYDFLHKPASVPKQVLQFFTRSTDFNPVEAVELFVSSVLGRFTLENSLSTIKKIRKRLEQQCSNYDFKQGVTNSLQHTTRGLDGVPGTRMSAAHVLFLLCLNREEYLHLSSAQLKNALKMLLIKPFPKQWKLEDLDDIQYHFKNTDKNLIDVILFVIGQLVEKDTDPAWIYALPLLHFLGDKAQPFTDPAPSPVHRTAEWWGTELFEEHISSFQRKTLQADWTSREEDLYDSFQDVFHADPLMIRTFVATLNLNNLVRVLSERPFPVEVIAASLFYHCANDSNRFKTRILIITAIVNRVQEETLKESQRIRAEKVTEKVTEKWRCNTVICSDLLKKVIETCRDEHALVSSVVRLQLAVADHFTHCVKLLHGTQAISEQCHNAHEESVLLIKSWFEDFRGFSQEKMKQMEECLEQSRRLLAPDLRSKTTSLFTVYILSNLKQLQRESKVATCLFLFERPDTIAADTKIDLKRILEDSLESGYLTRENQRQYVPVLQCLSQQFVRDFRDNVQDNNDCLQFALTYKHLDKLLDALGNKDLKTHLTHEVKEKLDVVNTALDTLMTQVIDGTVKVWQVRLLTTNKDNFIQIISLVTDKSVTDRVTRALNLRHKELNEYEDGLQHVRRLLDFCERESLIRTSDATEVGREFGRKEQTEDLKCVDFCQKIPDPSSITVDDYRPVVQIPGICEWFTHVIPRIKQQLQSQIFCAMLKEAATTEEYNAEVPFMEVLQCIWHKANTHWNDVCNSVRTGDASLDKAEGVFSIFDTEKNWDAVCRDELKIMVEDGDEGWIDKRLGQLEFIKAMKSCRDAAITLCHVKKAYELSGTIEDISAFLEVDMSRKLRNLKPIELSAAKALQNLSPAIIQHLEQFGSEKCKAFVEWVRKTMGGDGQRDVKVFVDLALNYVGDNPIDMDKVRNFQQVIAGYAPLIFQSAGDTETFLGRCRKVFDNVEVDPMLPAKLTSTADLLSWLDGIYKFHGSVEKNALAQVDNIIRRGILKMGKLHPEKKKGADIVLADVISLDLPADQESQSEAKTYRFNDLVDLQSRLMLVVGHAEKGRDNVDKFISVMESIERVAHTYIQLCRDGCLLFHNWAVKFYFGVDRPVCCIIGFFLSDDQTSQQLKGMRHSSTIEDYIAQIASFLETCHDSWLSYVEKKRNDYEQLNMYTMDQLVFLQEQLVSLDSSSTSHHLFAALSLLHSNCTKEDVETAIISVADGEADGEEEDDTDDEDEVRVAVRFIQHMHENGFSKQLAAKALKHVTDPNDLDEGIQWCMDHSAEVDEIEEESEDDGVLQSLLTRQGTIANALKFLEKQGSEDGMSIECLEEQLGAMWGKFLQTVKFSGVDCLSLHHLGLVLKHLAQKDDDKVDRRLPPYLKPGQPHLLLCPSREVLNTVTGLYMITDTAPLPQPDEVLLCRHNTTFEQVNMFLRRAFSASAAKKGKIHCLAFADHLDYDVSEKAERMIDEYVNTSESDYQFVVICTSENEFNAHMTAALEKYMRQPPVPTNPEKVLAYLKSKFIVPTDVLPINSAACVDPERSSVRVVRSTRAGMGKTLYKKRLVAKLQQQTGGQRDSVYSVTIPLHEKEVDIERVAASLLPHALAQNVSTPRIIHLDISYEVQEGVDLLLYSLLILGCITDVHGHVWRRSSSDLYLVEAMPLLEWTDSQEKSKFLVHHIFEVLPSVKCWSPTHTKLFYKSENLKDKGPHDLLFDEEQFRSNVFQRPFNCLRDLDRRNTPKLLGPEDVSVRGNQAECLNTLISHCGLKDPSWSELYHFASFLNKQLLDFQHSLYCSSQFAADLPGFAAFVLQFLIHMSKDFATRSLVVSEELVPAVADSDTNDPLVQFQMRRTWESSPHPYIFFNPDKTTMTFLGFTIDGTNFNLLDAQSGTVLQKNIMSKTLYDQLLKHGVPLKENFDVLERGERLQRLYQVMGVPDAETRDSSGIVDPDDTYELTTDNVKKIMAIYMRFRCDIPVIIMGETGCGKTRLVKFLCSLQTPKHAETKTMVLVKVHGGTTAEQIHHKVRDAETHAERNRRQFPDRDVYTVLFFDEANTTEAIGAIKEVMCDRSMNGVPIKLHENLKMVAACNPYRRHEKEIIDRLEKAGLGYHVSAEETSDKLGRLPMRQLVYRVRPLPQSMLPLIWDFGQLSEDVEYMYIVQMVRRFGRRGHLKDLSQEESSRLCDILVNSQKFMRELKDECSFVSLRDAERTLTVISWFLQQQELLGQTTERIEMTMGTELNAPTVATVLALGVCFRAGLRSKNSFEKAIVKHFGKCASGENMMSEQLFSAILDRCQDVLLDNVNLGEKIARNQALKENIFMMVVCVELRIPLFLVGKPGSSKSLAKSIVADAMQGAQAQGPLFKKLRETQMVSFQCSPIATADGVLSTFRQCAIIQLGKDEDKFVSVAVLDEIGLAEDSPRMPLKVLHPLLEEGCEVTEGKQNDGTEDAVKVVKVAFIGISNWALDPAKMNRGILVQREVPDEEELVQTARGICSSGQEGVLGHVEGLLKKLAKSYLSVFEETRNNREFFGLRDFYSFVKMIHATATTKGRKLTRSEFRVAIQRNFGGLDTFDPVPVFEKDLSISDVSTDPKGDRESSSSALLLAALRTDELGRESRYLLLLTENYGGLRILTDNLLNGRDIVPIFGSSFPKDQEYTQICCNINHIKVCMETGKTVILLNLDNLYESLYDALNQYYSVLAGTRYVDLGLGSHRVKCKVDPNFRLIVVAEKQTVYSKFPIPLINRLEKHFLTVSSLLTDEQKALQKDLEEWIAVVVTLWGGKNKNASDNTSDTISEHIIGYHSDTAAAIILMAWEKHAGQDELTEECRNQIKKEGQDLLLWCATPDSVVRTEDAGLSEWYFEKQQHEDLVQYLKVQLEKAEGTNFMSQVTTHSKKLTNKEKSELEKRLPEASFTMLSLQSFSTELQYQQQLSHFLREEDDHKHRVLLIQCERGDKNQQLLQCAQYKLQKVWSDIAKPKHHAVFIVQLPRVTSAAFSGFLGGQWYCAHLDDLRPHTMAVPTVAELQSKSPAQLLASEKESESDSTEVESGRQSSVSGSLDSLVRHLLLSRVQDAVACLRDKDGVSERAMQRIAILVRFLEDTDDPRFFSGIRRMMTGVMKEQEANNKDAKHWLARDACKPDWIRRTGTFRRAWMQSLERFVVPILAGVVAYLDTNQNLDLLLPGQSGDNWVQQLWLMVLSDSELCRLQYSDLQSMTGKQTQMKQFACGSTFLAKGAVPSRLPFSWLITEVIERYLIRATKDGADTTVQEVGENDQFQESLDNTTLGSHMRHVISTEEEANTFLVRYTSDLLHTTFALSEEIHKLLLLCMRSALSQMGVVARPDGMGHVLIQVHHVLSRAQPRLQSILDMATCCPSALEDDVLQEGSEAMLTDELVGDILLLGILVKNLTPQKNQLNKDKGCWEWNDLFSRFAPVILRVLADLDSSYGLQDQGNQNALRLGKSCLEHLEKIRCTWTRLAAVKLFMDYMSLLVTDAEKFQIDPKRVNYTLLWTKLGEKANLKTKKSLLDVDTFLTHANGQMVMGCLGDVGKCVHCKRQFGGQPIQLPCQHRLCGKCYKEEAVVQKECTECRAKIPDDFDESDFGDQNKEAVKKLQSYLKQANGFLMALLSQLCFTGQDPPEPEAVKHIFGYVIQRVERPTVRTRYLTLREDQIDPTPVLRSFILYLLLQHSEDQVNRYITSFLEDAKQLIQQEAGGEGNSGLIELSLLVIHCIENQEREKEATDEKRSERHDTPGFQRQTEYVTNLLLRVRSVLESSPLELDSLRSIGQLRYALAACARMLHSAFIEPAEEQPLGSLTNMCKEAGFICQFNKTEWPTKYFVKVLCREFGISAYSILLQRSQNCRCLQWVQLQNMEQKEMGVPDRYLVCGENYCTVRPAVMQALRGDVEPLRKAVNAMEDVPPQLKLYLVLLALHREVSTAVFITGPEKLQTWEAKTVLNVLETCGLPLDKDFTRRLQTNELGEPGSHLCLHNGQSLADQNLVFFLVHLWLALQAGKQEHDILGVLDTLLHQPEQMKKSYLPTMPEDNFDEIKEFLGLTESAGGPKIWECPNGHRYVIENCGRPNAKGSCPDCGAAIGGQRMHVETEGNRMACLDDRTQPGYILGEPENRSKEVAPERDMSPLAVALTRVLMHAALFICASQPGQNARVAELVNPPVAAEYASTFFWSHMQKDLSVLQDLLGKSCDDVFILLHYLCDSFAKREPGQSSIWLETKKARKDWEKLFCTSFLQALIQDSDAKINEGNSSIVKDKRQGDNNLMRILYETGEDNDVITAESLQHTAAPWKFRTPITVDHFFRQFQHKVQDPQTPSDALPLLRLFHAESHHLRALHFLPQIMSLQRRLIQQLRHRLHRQDVAKTTIDEMMNGRVSFSEHMKLSELLDVFARAWEIVKSYLVGYRCTTLAGKVIQLPKEFCNVCVNKDSFVGVLFPDTDGPGVCAYLLVHYLLVQHNSFLEMYCSIPMVKQRFDEVPKIAVHAVTKRHLVNCSPQVDLLPLVLAHSNYSLHLGQADSSMTVDYDFQGFELQLRNTLFLSKSCVLRNNNGSMDIETMVYCADTTYLRLFSSIQKKIKQVPMSFRLQRQITADFRDNLPDISQSIDNLNTALAYLLSLKVDPEELLSEFMTKTLKMSETVHSRKAQQDCRVKHVQCLWLHLCQQRAGMLTIHNEEAFDGQGKNIRKELTDEQYCELVDALRHLLPERVELLLKHIFECIMLQLLQHTDEDSANPDGYDLLWLVNESLDSPLYSEETEEKPDGKKQMKLTKDDLKHFPQTLMASQAIPCWIAVHRHLVNRPQHAQDNNLAL